MVELRGWQREKPLGIWIQKGLFLIFIFIRVYVRVAEWNLEEKYLKLWIVDIL